MRQLSRLLRAALLMSLVLGTSSARSAPGGVDGIEFQPVPVNINDQCSSVILKGTNKYRGYAFKLPQVILSVDKNLEDLFEIIPKGNGQYTLRFGLLFPLTEGPLELRRERSNLVINGCNDNMILADLNESERREAERNGTKPPAKGRTAGANGTIFENKIHTLSPLPMSSIEISVDGFPGMTKTIGSQDNNLLNYQNRDLVADFNIVDDATYDQLKAHLTGRMGLSVTIKMNFAARSVNGRVDFTMDLSSVAGSLEAAAGGRFALNQIMVAEADLRTYIAGAMARMNLNIRTQEGDNENFNRLAQEIMGKIIAANLQAVPMIPGQTWNPNACIYNPNGPGCQPGYPTYPTYPGTGMPGSTYPDPNGTGTGTLAGPPQPGLGPPGPRIPPATPNPDPNARYFNLGAVINVLKTASTQTFTWENLGRRENHSYTTSAVIRGNIPDPGFKTLNVVAGTSDSDAATLPTMIRAGQQVTIKIPGRRELVNKFSQRTTFLNKDEVRRQGMAKHFGALQEALEKNQLTEEISPDRGGYVAVYRQNGNLTAAGRWLRQSISGRDLTPFKFMWGIDELVRTTTMKAPVDIDLTEDVLRRLPMRVSFSKLGLRYRLADLVTSNDKWDGRYDEGMIVLTARQDLGYMKIRNDDRVNDPGRSAEKYLFQVREPILRSSQLPSNGQRLSDLRQYSWVKYSSSSDEMTQRVQRPDFNPFSFTKSVYVVMVRIDDGSHESNREEVRTTVAPSASQRRSPSPVVMPTAP